MAGQRLKLKGHAGQRWVLKEVFGEADPQQTVVPAGARPERLPQFEEDCWRLMEQCWACDPQRRPLLGDVELALEGVEVRQQDRSLSEDSTLSNCLVITASQNLGHTNRRPLLRAKDKYEMALPGSGLSVSSE